MLPFLMLAEVQFIYFLSNEKKNTILYLIVACFKLSNHSNLSFLSLILMTCNLFNIEAGVKYSLMPNHVLLLLESFKLQRFSFH